jgi:hypothetical protein
MARALKPGYVFSSNHDPIELNLPLWKLQSDRPAEYNEIIRQLKVSAADFKTIIAGLDSSAPVPTETGVDPAMFMTNCCAANVSFGWLLQVCLNHLPFNSEVVTLLRDLQVFILSRVYIGKV